MTAIKQYIHALMYIMHMLWFSSNIKWAFIDLGKYNMYKTKWPRASMIFKLWLKNNTLLYVKVIEWRISCCVIALYNIFMKVIVGNVFIKCFINQQPNTHCWKHFGIRFVVFTCFNDNESLHFLLYQLKEINGFYVIPTPLTYSILYEISRWFISMYKSKWV